MQTPTRLFDFPYYQLEHSPLKVMMTSKVAGAWRPYSTSEFVDTMNAVSRGLLEIGVKSGDKIALISHNNRCEWNIMDHAIMQIGAIDVPIYPTMTEHDIEYILKHSESKFCFVSNEELFVKTSKVKMSVPMLREIYSFEKVMGAKNWQEIIDLGKTSAMQPEVETLKKVVKEDDLASIIYTSGTTGLPKGVMLSHINVASNAVYSTERLPIMESGKSSALSFLPACHIYERMIHYLYVYNGVTIYFAEGLDTIKQDLQLSTPDMFTAVPRLLEKFFDGIVNNGTAAGGLKTRIFEWALALALKWQPNNANGGFYNFQLGIADKLVFSKIRTALGLTRTKAIASGSAALQPRLAQFFNGIGVPVLEGYGLTETSPVITVNTINKPNMMRIGTVGKAIKDSQLKIAEDGEILTKGPNVMMGYYKDEERTREVLTPDGWFHTGDIGEIEDGFLRITDRKKEMFKTSGGKYVSPQTVENALKASRFIEQAMVIGDGKKFPAALVVPSFDALKEWCRRKEIAYTTDAEMIKNKIIEDRVWKEVEKCNEDFGSWEKVKKIALLPAIFSVEGGELTPKLSLKRKPIMEKYKKEIADIYGE